MKGNKLLVAGLALAMVTSATACSKTSTENEGASSSSPAASSAAPSLDPFGKYNEPVTIRLVRTLDPNAKFDEGKSIENNDFIDEIKKQFNIDVKYDWISSPTDWNQKISLAISSNNLPDAFFVNLTQLKTLEKYDAIADLTDVFNTSGSDILKDFYKSGGEMLKNLVEEDGKLMAIPAPVPKASGMSEMWIRQDWLDKLGLKPPKNIEELKTVAKAFIEQDPDGNGKKDTIGIVGPSKSGLLSGTDGNLYGLDPIFAAHKSFPLYWLKDSSGKLVYGSTQPETKQALQTLADMYKQGLIDKDMLVRDDSLQPILDEKAGIFFGPWWTGYVLLDVYKKSPAPDWQAYAYPQADDGKYYAHMAAPANQFLVVNKKYKNPEAALKIINLLLRDEPEWVASGLGKNPGTGGAYPLYTVFDNLDEIEVSYDMLNKYLNGQTDINSMDFSTHKLLKDDMNAIKKLKKEPFDNFSINHWDLEGGGDLIQTNLPRLVSIMVGDRPLSTDKNIEEVYSLYYGQTETMASRWANLQKLEKEAFAKIIMGVAPVDSFDDFVDMWNKQGGDKILKEVADITE
ncbi:MULTISPECIES: extracellular solute-binding protein [unclassified Paenibacillus]|uniref:extracellular solute-binding protein n=1 Tax=unclassified Paenibacillus TaxID=185978 RepID=UPI0024067986|nr:MULTISPECIES: extracellular solute-binding protein [unclassified Paenibacillus]MDF9843157.1 putative aldouronate transport system substrate-binding protein [Paenibacillus sp. PastF-2]MDF9849631.1 putative aldouronate transport system substrate-binding protein [Paenibacillus sp. PastM-2]MDF9856452.1 putative aldouronate transport system substrate-binding protein [Paenibacillus sp. PastF-1]MDH6481723.1 putative aldouronate transport system substrate-binding protein [Paenibacillus sp. PastH-2]